MPESRSPDTPTLVCGRHLNSLLGLAIPDIPLRPRRIFYPGVSPEGLRPKDPGSRTLLVSPIMRGACFEISTSHDRWLLAAWVFWEGFGPRSTKAGLVGWRRHAMSTACRGPKTRMQRGGCLMMRFPLAPAIHHGIGIAVQSIASFVIIAQSVSSSRVPIHPQIGPARSLRCWSP